MIGRGLSLLGCIISEMEAYYEERSEKWQNSERGEVFNERKESLQEVAELMQDLV